MKKLILNLLFITIAMPSALSMDDAPGSSNRNPNKFLAEKTSTKAIFGTIVEAGIKKASNNQIDFTYAWSETFAPYHKLIQEYPQYAQLTWKELLFLEFESNINQEMVKIIDVVAEQLYQNIQNFSDRIALLFNNISKDKTKTKNFLASLNISKSNHYYSLVSAFVWQQKNDNHATTSLELNNTVGACSPEQLVEGIGHMIVQYLSVSSFKERSMLNASDVTAKPKFILMLKPTNQLPQTKTVTIDSTFYLDINNQPQSKMLVSLAQLCNNQPMIMQPSKRKQSTKPKFTTTTSTGSHQAKRNSKPNTIKIDYKSQDVLKKPESTKETVTPGMFQKILNTGKTVLTAPQKLYYLAKNNPKTSMAIVGTTVAIGCALLGYTYSDEILSLVGTSAQSQHLLEGVGQSLANNNLALNEKKKITTVSSLDKPCYESDRDYEESMCVDADKQTEERNWSQANKCRLDYPQDMCSSIDQPIEEFGETLQIKSEQEVIGTICIEADKGAEREKQIEAERKKYFLPHTDGQRCIYKKSETDYVAHGYLMSKVENGFILKENVTCLKSDPSKCFQPKTRIECDKKSNHCDVLKDHESNQVKDAKLCDVPPAKEYKTPDPVKWIEKKDRIHDQKNFDIKIKKNNGKTICHKLGFEYDVKSCVFDQNNQLEKCLDWNAATGNSRHTACTVKNNIIECRPGELHNPNGRQCDWTSTQFDFNNQGRKFLMDLEYKYNAAREFTIDSKDPELKQLFPALAQMVSEFEEKYQISDSMTLIFTENPSNLGWKKAEGLAARYFNSPTFVPEGVNLKDSKKFTNIIKLVTTDITNYHEMRHLISHEYGHHVQFSNADTYSEEGLLAPKVISYGFEDKTNIEAHVETLSVMASESVCSVPHLDADIKKEDFEKLTMSKGAWTDQMLKLRHPIKTNTYYKLNAVNQHLLSPQT